MWGVWGKIFGKKMNNLKWINYFCSQAGFANLSLECATCDCHHNGSGSAICDPENGQCLCKPNVVGLKCESCEEFYFGLTEEGCDGESLSYFKIN